MNSGFFYKTAADREKLVAAERKFVDDRVQQVIDLKKKVRFSENSLVVASASFMLYSLLLSSFSVGVRWNGEGICCDKPKGQ